MARNRDERDDQDEDEDDRPRRRLRDDDDEDFGDRPHPQSTNPASAKAAAIIWIIIGGLSLLGNGYQAAAGEGASIRIIVSICVTLAFLITGIQTLIGSVSSILGAGIASIILALIGLIAVLSIVLVGGALFGGGQGGLGMLEMVVAGIMLIGPVILLAAGILACIGSTGYKRWRKYLKPPSRRSRGGH